MSGRALALILGSLAYWMLALMFLAGMAIGDCFGNQACMAASTRALRIGLIASVGIYAAGLALFLFRPWRR